MRVPKTPVALPDRCPWPAIACAALAAFLTFAPVHPAQAQLPFTLNDCLADRDDDARLHICSIISGTDAQRAQGAIEASRILRARGEHEAAVELLDGRGRSGELDAELGHVWFEIGDIVMADFHFEIAMEAGYQPDEETRERMIAAAYLYGEDVQYSSDMPAGAVTAYDRALALDPDHLPSRLGRAEALQKLERHAEALIDLDRAVALGADWTGSLLRARTRLALGDEAGAAEDFRRVLVDNPSHAGAREALAALGAAAPASRP